MLLFLGERLQGVSGWAPQGRPFPSWVLSVAGLASQSDI